MKVENYEYLKDLLRMTGFGESLGDQLKERMEKGEPDFQLNHSNKIGDKEVSYTLMFNKSKVQDNYFFNEYLASTEIDGKVKAALFQMDQRITAKEAFNLLSGRSVEKKYNHHEKVEVGGKTVYKPIKDSTYLSWRKLDFNDTDSKGNPKLLNYGEKWGFKLEEELAKFPIRQMHFPEDRLELLNSLKKGNIQSVTFEQNNLREQRYVAASPRTRGIIVYDAKHNLISDLQQARNLTPAATAKEESQAVEQGENMAVGDDEKKNNTQRRQRANRI